MKSSLKIMTLNCWGIPFFTPQRRRRIQAITKTLKNGTWDVVALQEVWLKSDRDWIIQNSGFEFHATFDTSENFFGSGMLLLSKHKILKKDFQTFVSSGFPHLLHEMDYHTAKGIGYALLETPIGEVPIFITHLIAKYAPRYQHDNNRLFRMAQIIELVFYIRKMATPIGFILCGDLNVSDEELEFEMLCGLLGIPRISLPKLRSEKKCLDYVLCGASLNEINFKSSLLKFEFKESLENSKIPYSDHLGVSATIKKTSTPSHYSATHSVLVRSFRYMKYSVGLVDHVDRWIHWIPILGILFRHFMRPQMELIKGMLVMIEEDLKELNPKHPLRLR